MKKLSLFLALILIFSLFAPTTAYAAETDGNDTAPTATALVNGKAQGALSDTEDVDYYKIEATDDYYSFTFNVSASNLGADTKDGWTVTFYDSAMTELISYNVDNSITTPRFCIPGTIYIKVQPTSSSIYYAPVGILYDLSYAGGTDANWENEYNDLSTSANAINVNTTYHGSLHHADDADWFVVNPLDYFSVTFNKNMEIPTEWDVGDGWTITVYDSASNKLTSINVETAGTTITFPVGCPIFIKVEAKTHSTYYAPMHVYYDLKVNSATNSKWENEYNDSSATANTMKQGTVYHGNLQSADDVDFFKVKSTSNAIAVNFSISLDEVDPDYIKDGWKVTVYAADSGKSIASYTINTIGACQSITLPYAKGAYYFVKVEATSQSVYYAPIGQPYHISVIDDSNSKDWEVENGGTTVNSATALKEGNTIYGNLYTGSDKDYFKCNVISGGTIKLTFKRDASDNDSDGYKITVIDTAGNKIFSETVDNATSKSFSGIKVSKGTYYIIVEADSTYYHPGAEINYSISYALTISKHSVKASPTSNTIKLSWSKKSDVTGYQIEYATNKSFTDAKKVTISKYSTTSYTIKDTSNAKAYYVRLRTYVKDGDKTYYSGWTTIVALNTPKTAKVTPSKNTLKITWTKNSNVTGYQIEYATNKSFDNAKKVTISKNSTTSYTIKSTSAAKVYYVRVRTYVKNSNGTFYSPWTTTNVALNTATAVKVSPTKNTIKVSWTKNTGATGYQIEYATNKSFTSAKRITVKGGSTTSYTIKSTSATKVYYVRIRNYVTVSGKTYYSDWSTAAVAVNTPTVSKVTPSKGTLKASWTKNTGATGYEIQYSTSKTFSNAKTVTIKSNATTSVTIKNTSANKTYYVRMRTVSGTTYSPWSAAYSVKAK